MPKRRYELPEPTHALLLNEDYGELIVHRDAAEDSFAAEL